MVKIMFVVELYFSSVGYKTMDQEVMIVEIIEEELNEEICV